MKVTAGKLEKMLWPWANPNSRAGFKWPPSKKRSFPLVNLRHAIRRSLSNFLATPSFTRHCPPYWTAENNVPWWLYFTSFNIVGWFYLSEYTTVRYRRTFRKYPPFNAVSAELHIGLITLKNAAFLTVLLLWIKHVQELVPNPGQCRDTMVQRPPFIPVAKMFLERHNSLVYDLIGVIEEFVICPFPWFRRVNWKGWPER